MCDPSVPGAQIVHCNAVGKSPRCVSFQSASALSLGPLVKKENRVAPTSLFPLTLTLQSNNCDQA